MDHLGWGRCSTADYDLESGRKPMRLWQTSTDLPSWLQEKAHHLHNDGAEVGGLPFPHKPATGKFLQAQTIVPATFFGPRCKCKGNSHPWLVWLSGLSAGLKTKGSLVRFPVRAHAWVSGQVPNRGCVRGNHTLIFLFLSPSFPLPSPLSKNK